MERYPEVLQDAGTAPDPFNYLRAATHQATSEEQGPHSEVEYGVHRSLEVTLTDGSQGWVKCSVNIRIVCPQTERSIDVAGEAAFTKASELVNDGLSHMIEGTK